MDIRYGGMLHGYEYTSHADEGAKNIGNTDYDVLAAIFPPGSIAASDVLVDVGCGKGRVINWWLSRRLGNRIVGLEIEERIAAATQRRLRRFPDVTIIVGDAVANLPADGTIFYLYNPFQEPQVRAFRDRLIELCGTRSGITIYYYGPTHADLFSGPMWDVSLTEVRTRWSQRDLAIIRLQGTPGDQPAPVRAASEAPTSP